MSNIFLFGCMMMLQGQYEKACCCTIKAVYIKAAMKELLKMKKAQEEGSENYFTQEQLSAIELYRVEALPLEDYMETVYRHFEVNVDV